MSDVRQAAGSVGDGPHGAHPELEVDHVTVVEKGPLKKAISGATMGNLMEWYDFGIYGYLAATMTKVFQPENTDQTTGMIITYAVFAVSFLAAGTLALTAAVAYAQMNAYTTSNIAATPVGKTFVEVLNDLNKYYLHPVDQDKLLRGAIQGAFTFFSQGKPLVDSGNVRPLAIAAPKRMEAWPDVPTMTELGFAIDQRGFVGLAAPAKTPKPVVDFLSKHLNEVLQTDVFKKRMAELGMAPPPADENTPEKFDKFMREETARQGVLAEMTGQKIAAPK